MWLELVESKKKLEQINFEEREYPRCARVFVCGFGQTRESWAQALYRIKRQLKKQAFSGDVFVTGEFGYDVLDERDELYDSYPNPYCSGGAEIYDYEEEALREQANARTLRLLAHYDTIEIVAHSFGVRLAAMLLNAFPQEWFSTKKIRGIALAGTVSAVGDGVGVPKEQWANTLNGLSIPNMEQFYLNLFNTKDCYYNLRGAPGSIYSARKRQTKFKTQTEFKERLYECAANQGDDDYIKLAVDVCYNSARHYLFKRLSSIMRDYTGWSYEAQSEQRIVALSAELCFSPVAPLGKWERTRFMHCFKLHYAYQQDLICPPQAIKADLEQVGIGSAQVRTLNCPHLNCAQIAQLLLLAQHEDWDLVGQLVDAEPMPNLLQMHIVPDFTVLE